MCRLLNVYQWETCQSTPHVQTCCHQQCCDKCCPQMAIMMPDDENGNLAWLHKLHLAIWLNQWQLSWLGQRRHRQTTLSLFVSADTGNDTMILMPSMFATILISWYKQCQWCHAYCLHRSHIKWTSNYQLMPTITPWCWCHGACNSRNMPISSTGLKKQIWTSGINWQSLLFQPMAAIMLWCQHQHNPMMPTSLCQQWWCYWPYCLNRPHIKIW